MSQPAFTFSPQVKYLKPHSPGLSAPRLARVNGNRPEAQPIPDKPARPVLHLPKVQAQR